MSGHHRRGCSLSALEAPACDMGSETSEIHEENSVRGRDSSRCGLKAPWQQPFPEGPGVPLKGAAAGQLQRPWTHEEESDASLLTEPHTTSWVTFSS